MNDKDRFIVMIAVVALLSFFFFGIMEMSVDTDTVGFSMKFTQDGFPEETYVVQDDYGRTYYCEIIG